MNKACLFLVLWSLAPCIHANLDTSQAVAALQDAIRDMNAFKPADVIPSFNDTPTESHLKPREDGTFDDMVNAGARRAADDETTRFVTTQDGSRGKITPNPNTEEMVLAETLLDKPTTPDTGCADGSCDTTHRDESDDVSEGLSRLGALAGAADSVMVNQINVGEPTIFKGWTHECEEYRFGLRDCCTDAGFLDGLINCPASMQTLQHAKVEKRVVYLGTYKPRRFSNVRYVYCVFPSKLARIIQFDGRQGQLHIPFGTPKYPDCRGLTPEQLEVMDFKQFDLSSFIQDVTNKTKLPADNVGDTSNAAHVESMFDRGIPHD